MSSNLLMPPVVLLPSGIRQPWDKVLDYDYNVTTASKITINRVAGSAIAFTPNNAALVMSQLDKVPTFLASPITIVDVAPTFSGVVPSQVYGSDLPYSNDITGTNFISSPINIMKLDDGAGNIFTFTSGSGLSINSETDMVIGPWSFTTGTTFTLYWSTDNGMNYTSTGLTVTVN